MRHRTIAIVTSVLAALLVPASFAGSSAAPSLNLTPRTIEYGKELVTLSGVVPGKRAGATVTILSQACLFTEAAEIGTTKSVAGGIFRFRLQPLLNTSFRVRSSGATSAAVKVSVRPTVLLRRVAPGRYRAQVATTNPVFLNGKPVFLQRLAAGKWVTIKRATLAKASPETAITVLSAATLVARTTGTVRALVPAARGCYLPATSNTVPA